MNLGHPRTFLHGIMLLGIAGAGLPAAGLPPPDTYVDAAVGYIENGHHELARVYLEPALIDPRLTAAQRARAYYLRGYSLWADGASVSAAKDYYRALEFDPANAPALNALGHMFLTGDGVAHEEAQALRLFEAAAETGHIPSQMAAAVSLLQGRGVEPDPERARSWLTRAVDAGHTPAMVLLAQSHRAPYSDNPDPQAAMRWYERAISAGSVQAMIGLGHMFRSGELGDPDPALANELFLRAADLGSGAAKVLLGYAYQEGEGVAPNEAAARRLFEEGAALGNATAYRHLGYLYETGRGVPPDTERAIGFYRQGAAAGDSYATRRLGRLLIRQGRLREALPWLKALADEGRAGSQNDYAWVLATHRDENVRDGTVALRYARMAVAHQATAETMDTLAAAHAELGHFADAVATQERAVALASEDNPELADELALRLATYRRSEPWRE